MRSHNAPCFVVGAVAATYSSRRAGQRVCGRQQVRVHGGELASSLLCDRARFARRRRRRVTRAVDLLRGQILSSSPTSREFLDPVLRALGPQLLVALRKHDGLLVPQDEAEEGHRDQAEAEHDPNVIVNVVHREADAVLACRRFRGSWSGAGGWVRWVHVHRT